MLPIPVNNIYQAVMGAAILHIYHIATTTLTAYSWHWYWLYW